MTGSIAFGVIGGGYMGKAHAKALHAVGATFNTNLRPQCDMICTTSLKGAEAKARELGFRRWTDDWRVMINDPEIEAIVIASPQHTHREIAVAALEKGKAVFCEKPLGASLSDCQAMVDAARRYQQPNMVGYNYIRTPASQLAREIIRNGEIGDISFFRGEHSEDFLSNPETPANWRTEGRANGTMGDLAPHIINAALALVGPITELVSDIATFHHQRPHPVRGDQEKIKVLNDDQAHFLCRFANNALGNLFCSRIATGCKMGYMYEIYGSKGAIKFEQEDQNALWLYKHDSPHGRAGFTKIMTGPEHPDFKDLCPGVGHGTGYQEQITIEMRDFLLAIEQKKSVWPDFEDGLMVNKIIDAAWRSQQSRGWEKV